MRKPLPRRAPATLALALLWGCAAPEDTGAPEVNGPVPAVSPAEPTLRRLTQTQYEHTVRDLLGADIVLPTSLEPDSPEAGLLSVGAAVSSLSSLGVERYEDAAFLLAGQVVEEPERWDLVVGCTPTGTLDEACAFQLVEQLGRRAWRRDLKTAELDRLVGLLLDVAEASGSFEEGAFYVLGALLQSPHFLYRVEHGEPDPDDATQRLLTDWELATRLAYLLTSSTPDDELLDAAAAGTLSDPDELDAQARRLLATDAARDGVRALFDELFELYELEHISKDPTVFTHASEDLGPAAREETLLVIEDLVFDQRRDFRQLLSTQSTFVDSRLAALYSIPAPALEGFGAAWLEPEQGRRGLLGQASFLMLEAHATRSSATLRGKFIQQTLLCRDIPSPPADVDTSIPEPDETSPTLRDRIQVHLEDPTCAACHNITDPIGLGLENFDGIARWRDTENGALIDATGELDDVYFEDAWELAVVVEQHPELGPCLSTHLYEYAVGHPIAIGEYDLRSWLAVELELSGYDWQSLLLAMVASPGFRRVGAFE